MGTTERQEWLRSGDKGVGVVKCHAPHVLAARPERAKALKIARFCNENVNVLDLNQEKRAF